RALRLCARKRPRGARRRGQGAGRERGRQGVLSRRRRRPAQIVPRGQALPAAQALAGVVRLPRPGRARQARRGEESATPACDLMADRHHDSLETRDPDDRERDFFGRLPDLIALALSAPGWASQLAGVDPNAVTSRAALAKLPVLRKSELATRQKERPPFG